MIKATLRPTLAALALIAALWCAPDAGARGMRAAYPSGVVRPAPAVGDNVTTPLCEGFHLGNSLDAREVAPGRPLWLSRDPLGEAGGLNLYGFVGNDPVNKWDYLGLFTGSELLAMGNDRGVKIPSLLDPTFRHSGLALKGLLSELPEEVRTTLLETDYSISIDFWVALGAIADGQTPAMFQPPPAAAPAAPQRGAVRFLNNLNAFFEGTGISGAMRSLQPTGRFDYFADNPLSGGTIGVLALTQDGEETGRAIAEGLRTEQGRYTLAGSFAGIVVSRKFPSGRSFESVRSAAIDELHPALAQILELDPNARVGIRGSVARGRKGDRKGGGDFDVDDFDVDAFIVSDELASFYTNRFRETRGNPDLIDLGFEDIVNGIDDALRQNPALRGLRDELFDFRIFKQHEIDDLLRSFPDEAQLYLIGE